MNRIIIASLALALISQPAFARTKIQDDTVVETQKIKRKRYFWTKQLDDLKINGKVKHIPENNKVIIPYFRVTFVTGGKYLNAVGGITSSKTKVFSSLNGVDESTMQSITNAMYDDLVNQFKEAGYEVLPIDHLKDNETYAKLQEKSDYPDIDKNKAQFTAENRYYPGTIAVKAYMLANEVDALMVKADYTVNFIVLNENKKKFNILNDKSDVQVGQGINVFGELAILTEKGPVAFLNQQPIGSDKPFGETVDATTAMNKVSDGVALVGSLLNGRVGDRQSTNTVEINADNHQYAEAVKDALSKSNQTLVNYMDASINEEELSDDDLTSDE